MFQFEKVTEILHWKPPSVFKEEIFEEVRAEDIFNYIKDIIVKNAAIKL